MKKIFGIFVLLFLSFQVEATIPSELHSSIDQIYNGNFAAADATIGSYISSHPKDAAGYLMRGISREWNQSINNKGKSLNSQIAADYEKARVLSLDAWEKDENNLAKKVMVGNAYMYVAKKQLDMGHKLNAGNSLKKAKNLMMEVLEKDANNADAYFAIGIFNYFSANVPAGFKWLASLLGFTGSRATGLEYIQKAASVPNLAQGDASFMMVYIYKNKEKNYSTALKYNTQLRQKYPNNPLFLFDEAEIYWYQKNLQPCRAGLNQFLTYCSSHACAQQKLFLSHYYLTKINLDEKSHVNAKENLLKAIELDTGKNKEFTAHLRQWQEDLAAK